MELGGARRHATAQVVPSAQIVRLMIASDVDADLSSTPLTAFRNAVSSHLPHINFSRPPMTDPPELLLTSSVAIQSFLRSLHAHSGRMPTAPTTAFTLFFGVFVHSRDASAPNTLSSTSISIFLLRTYN